MPVGRITHQIIQQPGAPVPPPRATTIFGPRTVGDITLDPESGSATNVTLNYTIETLVAAKSTVEIAPLRMVFESAIVILRLVRVRAPVQIPFLAPTYLCTTRMR